MMDTVRVCVLGAGVVGLTTATVLQAKLPHLRVTVVADRFTEDTLSHVAAGIFRPSPSGSAGPDMSTTRRWVNESYAYYRALLESPQATEAGVRPVTCVALSADNPSVVHNPLLEELLPVYRSLTAEELKTHPGDTWTHGRTYDTMVTECTAYLPFLMKKFKDQGGVIVKRRVESLVELAPDFDVVINCSGFGARNLCNDHSVTPIRGQVFKVKAPWVKQCLYGELDTYIIPGLDTVTLGGTRQYDSWNLKVDRHDSNSIWERCLTLLPSLRNAHIVKECVGLRPYRHKIRVELELLPLPQGGFLKVIHNYGHGGYGVTMAPGTAFHVERLLQDMLLPASAAPFHRPQAKL